MVKTKPPANEALSEAWGHRRSVMPAQVLPFPSARGKAAPCLVNIPRYSPPQSEEDSITSADLSLHSFPKRAPPSRVAAGCVLNVCMPPPAGSHCHCARLDSCHSGWARLFTQACLPREQPCRAGEQLLGSPVPHLPSMWTAANRNCLQRMMSQ